MLVAVDHDAHEENAGEQASLEALFERRRRRSFLTRIALRRVPPHEALRPIRPRREARIKPEPNRFSPKPAKGRRRSSFTFTGVGGLLGQVATADSATIAAAGNLSVVSVVGASTVGRRMVHGERAEVIKERVSQRCRMIGESVGNEEELRRSWQKKHGSSAVGLDAEIAKLRATHSAKYAFFETRENVRIKRAAFDARRASSVENERVARRFSLDSRRAAEMASPQTVPWGAQLRATQGPSRRGRGTT